jgi:DNA-binding response OmpR family regulator
MADEQDLQTSSEPTILLIEDDPFLVNIYREKFENEGFKMIVAKDGEQGLELALKEKVDVIILDLLLPKLSGIDILNQLREKGRQKDTPIVVLTNLTQEKEAKESLQLGVKEYLIKANLTPGQLAEKIRKYL